MDILITVELFMLIATLTVFKYILNQLNLSKAWLDDLVLLIVGVLLSIVQTYNVEVFAILYNAIIGVGVAIWGRNFMGSTMNTNVRGDNNEGVQLNRTSEHGLQDSKSKTPR